MFATEIFKTRNSFMYKSRVTSYLNVCTSYLNKLFFFWFLCTDKIVLFEHAITPSAQHYLWVCQDLNLNLMVWSQQCST